MSKIALPTQAASRAPIERQGEAESLWLGTLHRVWRNPFGAIGLSILVVTILVAVLAPLLTPYQPNFQNIGDELLGPSLKYPLGTDELGRDLMTRLMYGARISLLVGLVSVGLGVLVGVTTGLAAGYWGGWIETVIMRVWDTVLAFPAILLGIAVAAILGPGVVNAAIAVGVISMPQFARISRASMISEKERDYVLAARAMGVVDARVVFQQILPNILTPLLVQVTLAMAFAVLLEAGLSFLGLGAQPPDPSWGSILSTSRMYIRDNAWYSLFPGIALSSLLLGLNFLSDAIRDALDPRQKNLI